MGCCLNEMKACTSVRLPTSWALHSLAVNYVSFRWLHPSKSIQCQRNCLRGKVVTLLFHVCRKPCPCQALNGKKIVSLLAETNVFFYNKQFFTNFSRFSNKHRRWSCPNSSEWLFNHLTSSSN